MLNMHREGWQQAECCDWDVVFSNEQEARRFEVIPLSWNEAQNAKHLFCISVKNACSAF